MYEEEFYLDFEPYTDQYGMVQDKSDGERGITSGNGNLYSAHYILALVDNELLTEERKQHLREVYHNNERELGLLMRAPDNRNGYNAHDDLIGAATASKFIDDGALARRIIAYGMSNYPKEVDISEGPDHPKTKLNKTLFPILQILFNKQIKWVWNNINPRQFHITSWLFRRSDVIATLELVGYRKTSLFRYAFLTIMMLGIIFQNKNADHNAFILRYHMARAIDGVNPYTTFLANIVRSRVLKIWSNIGDVIGEYYQNQLHPSAKWLRKSI